MQAWETYGVAGYELLWPRSVFAAELSTILRGPRWQLQTERLLEEAFRGTSMLDDFTAQTPAGWGDDNPRSGGGGARQWALALLQNADRLPQVEARALYYPQRRGVAPRAGPRPVERLRQDFARYIEELHGLGYLDEPDALPRRCVDSDDREVDPQQALSDRLEIAVAWPLRSEEWDEDTFYGLIEVVHDLVARPRERWWHDYARCGWHYTQFAVAPGRALYRERVDRLLAAGAVPLQLAADGEDAGRLVHAPRDDRDELVVTALAAPPGPTLDTIAHAVSLFRRRSASGRTSGARASHWPDCSRSGAR